MESKTIVVYTAQHDPTQDGVSFVAIQSEWNPAYVWAVYSHRKQSDLPKLGSDLVILPIEAAKKLFTFKKVDHL